MRAVSENTEVGLGKTVCGNTVMYLAGVKILGGVGSGPLLRCVALEVRCIVLSSALLRCRRCLLWRLAALLAGVGLMILLGWSGRG